MKVVKWSHHVQAIYWFQLFTVFKDNFEQAFLFTPTANIKPVNLISK